VSESICVFAGALNKCLRNDEIINGAVQKLLPLISEHPREFAIDAKNAAVRTENSGRFRSLLKQVV
jgi:hypothetical protein